MSALVVVGAQWGDEGKGKVTDFLASSAHLVARYQGGNNAGHTIKFNNEIYKLHLIPSGILREERHCALGNGVVVDLLVLVQEIEALEARGISTKHLHISENAHLIFKHHIELDKFSEASKGSLQIGTTQRGIGPAYLDKVNRNGLRVIDLSSSSFPGAYARQKARAYRLMDREYSLEETQREIEEQLSAFKKLQHYVEDVGELIEGFLDQGENVLFEGAQGTFLDLDHGTYPYVTSSTPTAAGACVGTGIGPTRIDHVLGVTKAYTTRVGGGPFPTELFDEIGLKLRADGQEFGTTTGRARRCGWLDTVMLRYASRINGLTSLAVMKLDVLDELDEIKVCTAYEIDGARVSTFPNDLEKLERAKPIYESFPGWKRSTQGVKELPSLASRYLAAIEELVEVPIDLISVGADRSATIVRRDPWA